MKERPIIFSAPMVRAILAGTKTQTRRKLRAAPGPWDPSSEEWRCLPFKGEAYDAAHMRFPVRSPVGGVGETLWVREAFALAGAYADVPPHVLEPSPRLREFVRYRADGNAYDEAVQAWRPSIHMPRWAARIELRVTSLRVQRLRDITEADILAEGVTVDRVATWTGVPWSSMPTLHHAFGHLWDSLHGAGAWDADPIVWAIGFEVTKKPAAAKEVA